MPNLTIHQQASDIRDQVWRMVSSTELCTEFQIIADFTLHGRRSKRFKYLCISED